MALLGIDEVGRGPLAGPLVVGAVILPEERPEWIEELNDSKKLSARKRERLAKIITEEAAYGLGWVSPMELDEVGILAALKLATRRAVEEVQKCHVAFSQIVIDGTQNFLEGTRLERYVSTAVKADALVKEVSAASIVAKVARDQYMAKVGERFPEYGFEKHVGYGTRQHLDALSLFGVCPEHRKSFEPVRSMVGFEKPKSVVKNTTKIGDRGETAVSEYLMRAGHTILMRNFKTYFYEIDIISEKDGVMYFTEVKTRKNDYAGGGMAAVDQRKLKQMRYAAECYMGYRQMESDALLAVASVNGEYEVEEWLPIR